MGEATEVSWATVRQIADDPRVLAVYAAPEFDELSDDGKAWTKALVEVAFAVALAAAEQRRPAGMMAGEPLTLEEQRDQASRCPCAGADDFCPCQNVPDGQTRTRRVSVASAALKNGDSHAPR